jgi:tetratricopeptide (TPR) repeat protein
VLYDRVLLARRVQLHRQIGLRLEAGYGTRAREVAAELALHFEQGREAQRAVQYLRQAAQNALRHSAHREAAQYSERALQTLAHLPQLYDIREQVIDLHLELRNALVPLGEFARILTHLRDAETLAQELGDIRRLGRITAYLTRDFHMTGEHVAAVTSGLRALTMVQEDAALRVTTHLYLSYAYYALGEYRRVLEILRPEVALLTGALTRESFGLAALPAVSARVNMVYSLTELGEFPEGIELGIAALKIAEAAGHPFSLTQAYRGLGGLYLQQGQLDRAIPLLEQGLAVCEKTELPLAFPTVASYLGTAYAQAGRLHEALPLLEQAVVRGAAMQLGDRQTLRMVLLGVGYLHAGRPQDALRLTQDALALARQRQERGFAGYALHLLGELAARQTTPEGVAQAETYYRQAMALASDLGMRPLLAHSALGLGTLYGHTERQAQAPTVLSTAITLFDAMSMGAWCSRAQTVVAHLEAG